jgi:hypothetical protein
MSGLRARDIPTIRFQSWRFRAARGTGVRICRTVAQRTLMEPRDDRGPASTRNSFAWLVMSADLIMGSEVWAPAPQAFDIIVMGIVEPHSEALSPRFLSNVVFCMVVDCDLPLRDRPNIPWSERCVSRHLPPIPRATLLPSEILDGYTRPFPSQVGQERNAGTFKRSWSGCTAATHPLPRQLGHPSYRRHFLIRSAEVIHSCLPASSRSNAAAGRA